MTPPISSRSTVKLVEVTRAPLGFFVLALLIVEAFLCTVLLGSDVPGESKVALTYVGVGMFVLVILVVAVLVWKKPQNLIFDKQAHLDNSQMRAAASLAVASANSPIPTTDDDIGRIADMVRTTTSAGAVRDAVWKRRVLWVDDQPDNNRYERLAFEEALDLRFTLAQSTNEGLEKLQQNRYAVIISDMGRREGPREGYALLDRLRKQGDGTPFFFYTSSNDPQHKRETLDHGGQGATNDPQELFEMVTSELLRS